MKIRFLTAFCLVFLASMLVLAQPDLRFSSSITASSDPVRVGDSVTFTVRFLSGGAAVDNFKIIGGVDSTRIVDRVFAHVNADTGRAQTMNWTATAGSHTIWFELDPDHLKHDSDYTNNRVEITLNVEGGLSSPARSADELGNITASGNTGGLSNGSINSGGRRIIPADDCSRFDGETADVLLDFLGFNRVSLRVDDPIEYRYEVKIKNLSRKCIYRLKYKLVDQGGAVVREVTLIPARHTYVIKSMETATFSNIIGIRDITNFNRCRVGIRTYICSTITATLDPDNEIPESNEGNNSKSVGPIYWNSIED